MGNNSRAAGRADLVDDVPVQDGDAENGARREHQVPHARRGGGAEVRAVWEGLMGGGVDPPPLHLPHRVSHSCLAEVTGGEATQHAVPYCDKVVPVAAGQQSTTMVHWALGDQLFISLAALLPKNPNQKRLSCFKKNPQPTPRELTSSCQPPQNPHKITQNPKKKIVPEDESEKGKQRPKPKNWREAPSLI